MDGPDDVAELLARLGAEDLVCTLLCCVAEELRDRCLFDRGGAPHLVVQFGIEPQTSHAGNVSRRYGLVIQLAAGLMLGPLRGIFPAIGDVRAFGNELRIRDERRCDQISAM